MCVTENNTALAVNLVSDLIRSAFHTVHTPLNYQATSRKREEEEEEEG